MPARSRLRRNTSSSPASQSPARRAFDPRGPNRAAKRATACAPPIGTTVTPSAERSRPRRAARVSIAIWSLDPSTRTTAHAPSALANARKVASGPPGGSGPPRMTEIFPARNRDGALATTPVKRENDQATSVVSPDRKVSYVVLGADYPFLDVLWTMLIFFCFVIWFMLLFRLIIDI